MKKCHKCKLTYDITNFHKDKSKKDGLSSRCKVCQNKISKTYRENNPEYFIRKNKEHYDKTQNPKRYKKYQKEYLDRIRKYRQTVRGKLLGLLKAAKCRSKKSNLKLDIDIEWLLNQYEMQKGKCALTGIDFTLSLNEDKSKKYIPFNPSIDRIDSSKGYTKDNVRLVCTIVNLALNSFGDETFKKMCTAYIKHNQINLDSKNQSDMMVSVSNTKQQNGV
jgi:hypothetical protein